MEHFAICIRCKNSMLLRKMHAGNFVCPLCGKDFGTQPENISGLLVQFDIANQSYETGQEYFRNTDFGEALKYFEQAKQYNPNHYLAVYFAHMCKIYEQESTKDFDLIENIVNTLIESVKIAVLARIEISKRLGFFILIFNECTILISNFYKKITGNLEQIDHNTRNKLRQDSLKFAISLRRIISIDKEDVLAHNPNISKFCLTISDLGIMACNTVVQPYVVQNSKLVSELNLPSDSQYYRVKNLCRDFMSYAQSLKVGFVQSASTNYGDVLLYIDKHVIPMRNRYYETNKAYTNRFLSYYPDIFKRLSSTSSFAVKYAHRICFHDLFGKKSEYYDLLIYESVDNCFDSLMPRIQLLEKGKKVDIYCISLRESLLLASHLNDFLRELYKINREYAIKKVYSYFRYVYDGVHRYYQRVKKNYFKVSPRLDEDEYRLELGRYLNFLYQVVSTCVLTALVVDIDKNVVDNKRDDMLQLALDACIAFDSMSDIDATSITDLERFSDFEELFDIVKAACGLDRGLAKPNNANKKIFKFG
ncbi:MAG: tetratricopeptide repeat protein [Firmicutes bacterium]|nr:tetratricopeptide repeat protein [Bacillota bacterium]MCL1944938.1 tetratricopeptide repeat protein [Bacillota bacterium]MCL1954268.1 tetratricopeptide repeat protein [Bacillota bacterium]